MANGDISKPGWPSLADESWLGYYPFLASVEFSRDTLKRCYIVEAIVTKLCSRQTVSVTLTESGVTADDVPVWVHTDVGTRVPTVLNTEQVVPADYFKDAALMFPLEGATVLVVVYIDPDPILPVEVKGVMRVLTSANKDFTISKQPPPTYRLLAKYRIAEVAFSNIALFNYEEFGLYDLTNDRHLLMPTRDAFGVQGAPVFEAKGLPNDDQIDLLLATGTQLGELGDMDEAPTLPVQSFVDRGCSDYFTGNCICNGQTISPGWEAVHTPPTHSYTSYCFNGTGTYLESYGGSINYTNPMSVCDGLAYFRTIGAYGEDLAPVDSSGTLTLTNGVVLDFTTATTRVQPSAQDPSFTETAQQKTTVTFNGVAREHTISITTEYNHSDFSFTAYSKKAIIVNFPIPDSNLFSLVGCTEKLYIYRKEVGIISGASTYTYLRGSDVACVYTGGEALINTTQFYNDLTDRIVELFETGVVPWHRNLYWPIVQFMGYYIVPFDVRAAVIISEEG